MKNIYITVSKIDLSRHKATDFRSAACDALTRLAMDKQLSKLTGHENAGPIYPTGDLDWVMAALTRARKEGCDLCEQKVTAVVGQARERRVIQGEREFDLKGGLLSHRGSGGLTILHYAALANRFDLVELLVSLGMSVDVADVFGSTPLHYAAASGHLDMAKRLLDLAPGAVRKNGVGFEPFDITNSPEVSKLGLSKALAGLERPMAEKVGRRL